MIKVNFEKKIPFTISLPESITVNGQEVKGEYYFYDDDTSYEGTHYEYWQYQGDDWIVWFDLSTAGDSVHIRATCDNENYWALDDYIKFDNVNDELERTIKSMNEYYKELKMNEVIE